MIAAIADGETRIRNYSTGADCHSTLACVRADQTIVLWDLPGNRRRAVLRGPATKLGRPEFSPDGTRLAAAAEDRTIRVWDTATGNEVLVLRGHPTQPRRATKANVPCACTACPTRTRQRA